MERLITINSVTILVVSLGFLFSILAIDKRLDALEAQTEVVANENR